MLLSTMHTPMKEEGRAVADGIGRVWYLIISVKEGLATTPKYLVQVVEVCEVIN